MPNTNKKKPTDHVARRRAMHERKVIRRRRADIHAAMEESLRMKRSKKAGRGNLDTNMLELGFERQTRPSMYDKNDQLPITNGHVDERFRRVA